MEQRRIITPISKALEKHNMLNNKIDTTDVLEHSIEKLFIQFMNKVDNEKIKLDSVTDLEKLFNVYTSFKELKVVEDDKKQAEESEIKSDIDLNSEEVQSLYKQIMQSYNDKHDEENR